MRTPFIKIAAVVLLLATVLRNSARGDSVDDYVRAEMQKRQIPGAAVAVVKQGLIVKIAGYGLADIEHGVSVTPESVFDLASVTKQFTASAIMILVQEGKIELDAPIRRYLDATPHRWADVTVRELLTHTSGLPSLEQGFKSLRWTATTTTDEMYQAAKEDRIDFAPGTKWQYSDEGYFLLGMIIEKVSGEKYTAFLSERIFEPLGMTATGEGWQFRNQKRRVHGYTIYQERVVDIQRGDSVPLPAFSGIFSSVGDLSKWDAALYSDKILKPASLAQMWTRAVPNGYGFGWYVESWNGHRVIDHTGITGTQITRLPDDGLTVIVLTNLGRRIRPGYAAANPWGLTRQIATYYLPELAPLDPNKRQVAIIDYSSYDRYVGTYQDTYDGLIRVVTRRGDRLSIEDPNQQRTHEIFPESTTEFFSRPTDAQWSFAKVENENAQSLIIHQNGFDTVLRRSSDSTEYHRPVDWKKVAAGVVLVVAGMAWLLYYRNRQSASRLGWVFPVILIVVGITIALWHPEILLR